MPVDDKNLSDKVCESCGKGFSCGADAGKCWCFEIELAEHSLENLEKDFKNCLCRECLTGYNEENSVSK